jgi:hypothetical protein
VQLRIFLLGCCTLSLGVHFPVFQDHVVVSSSRVRRLMMNTLLLVIKYRIFSNLIHTQIYATLVFADFLNEKKVSSRF